MYDIHSCVCVDDTNNEDEWERRKWTDNLLAKWLSDVQKEITANGKNDLV
jgi:hypothetical protein